MNNPRIEILDCEGVLSKNDGDVLWFVTDSNGLVLAWGFVPGDAGYPQQKRAEAMKRAVAAWELRQPTILPLPPGFESTEDRLAREAKSAEFWEDKDAQFWRG